MTRFLKITAGILVFVLAALVLGRFLPIPVLHSDFMSLYHALLGWTKGFSFYDFTEQQRLMFETTRLTEPDFTIEHYPYFPYPPWYAGATFFLALFSFEWAYRAWFFFNIGVLALAAWLLTIGRPPRIRALAMAAFVIYFPSIGLLVVGNYTLPVLLGGALFLYAVQREDAILVALGIALMTFKPHIGVFMGLFAYGWLWREQATFAIRARWMTIIAGLVLVLVGFVVEPRWPVTFLQSLHDWQTASYIRTCTYCSSPSNIIMRLVGGQAGMLSSTAVSLGLLLLTMFLIWLWRVHIFTDARRMLAMYAALTAVALPYMVNYDFVILLIPLTVSFLRYPKRLVRYGLGMLYLLPWFGLLFGRAGNILLTLTGLAMFGLLLLPDEMLK